MGGEGGENRTRETRAAVVVQSELEVGERGERPAPSTDVACAPASMK